MNKVIKKIMVIVPVIIIALCVIVVISNPLAELKE